MFTNGMKESFDSTVFLRDVHFEAFQTMLEFIYTGELKKEVTRDINTLLLQLLLLADKFGISLLHQECCKTILEHLSEVISRLFSTCIFPAHCLIWYLVLNVELEQKNGEVVRFGLVNVNTALYEDEL